MLGFRVGYAQIEFIILLEIIIHYADILRNMTRNIRVSKAHYIQKTLSSKRLSAMRFWLRHMNEDNKKLRMVDTIL